MKIMITGATGQLGTSLVKELKKRGFADIFVVDAEDFDISNKDACQWFFANNNPEIIFHLAAKTDVDDCEAHPEECNRINVLGTENIVEGAIQSKAELVFISTDYVFDGKKPVGESYATSDIRRAMSEYARSKIRGEVLVSEYPNHRIIRTSAIFAPHFKNFPSAIMNKAKTECEISVVNDQTSSYGYAPDVASMIVDIALKEKPGIYHAVNEGSASRADFARYLIKKAKLKCTVIDISKKNIAGGNIRPANSVLSTSKNSRKLRTWEKAIDAFLVEEKKL